MNFIEELKWRGMIHDIMPGTEEQLKKELSTAYVGIDPTADSLHIGHLVSVMLLKHFQKAGHKPLVLIGGATGMIGDPSGKSEERNLLDEETLRHNVESIKKQLVKFLDFDSEKSNCAEIVNNYDWTKDYTFLTFLRDIGKHITVNYMMSKDSVKKRLETGLSFTEFSYQLLQGYDFYWLFKNKNCKLQMGGADQWGNIVTGTELIRRKASGESFAITTPLLTKADGGKFGKTESGNVWLDPEKTSPHKFYQFWLNCSDEDAVKYTRIFTFYSQAETELMIKEHLESPHFRLLQKTLAKDITLCVHGEKDYEAAVEASSILFGNGTAENLKNISENMFLSVFEGIPQSKIDKESLQNGINIIEFLTEKTKVFASKGEARRLLKENGVSINKEKVNEDFVVTASLLLNNKYILAQKGKKNYFVIIAE